jgi:DNA-binding transcriptional MerR regulator
MGVREMDALRSRLRIDQAARLRLIISQGGAALGLECSECEELLEWVPEKTWWVCGCGLETTPTEAREVMEQARDALDQQIESLGGRTVRQKGFWEWLRDKFRRGRPALPGS